MDMTWRHLFRVSAGLLAVLVVLVGVRIADPAFLMDSSPSVDLSDPPGEVVQDAIRDLHSSDYTVALTADGGPVYERRIENTELQSFTVDRTVPPPERRVFFRTDGMEWTRRGTGEWQKFPPGRFRSRRENPLVPPERPPNATVINETGSTLVIRVDGEDDVRQIIENPNCLGPVVFVIDKNSRRLTEVRRQKQCPREQRHMTYRFTDYGETEVERPDDVPRFSVEEFLWDLL